MAKNSPVKDPEIVELEREAAKRRLEKENAELQAGIAELSKDPGDVALQRETTRLRLQMENTDLRARIAELAQPWWRKGSSVATVTAIIAAILPITTLVQGYVQKSRELAMEEEKSRRGIELEKEKTNASIALERERQTEQLRTAYLERLKTPGEHLRTLRFVIATTRDPSLKAWAVEEKKQVEAEVQQIQGELDKQEAAAAASVQSYIDALARKGMQPSELEQRRVQAEVARAKRDDLKKALQVLLNRPQSACDGARSLLSGRDTDQAYDEAVRGAGMTVPNGMTAREYYRMRCEAQP